MKTKKTKTAARLAVEKQLEVAVEVSERLSSIHADASRKVRDLRVELNFLVIKEHGLRAGSKVRYGARGVYIVEIDEDGEVLIEFRSGDMDQVLPADLVPK